MKRVDREAALSPAATRPGPHPAHQVSNVGYMSSVSLCHFPRRQSLRWITFSVFTGATLLEYQIRPACSGSAGLWGGGGDRCSAHHLQQDRERLSRDSGSPGLLPAARGVSGVRGARAATGPASRTRAGQAGLRPQFPTCSPPSLPAPLKDAGKVTSSVRGGEGAGQPLKHPCTACGEMR